MLKNAKAKRCPPRPSGMPQGALDGPRAAWAASRGTQGPRGDVPNRSVSWGGVLESELFSCSRGHVFERPRGFLGSLVFHLVLFLRSRRGGAYGPGAAIWDLTSPGVEGGPPALFPRQTARPAYSHRLRLGCWPPAAPGPESFLPAAPPRVQQPRSCVQQGLGLPTRGDARWHQPQLQTSPRASAAPVRLITSHRAT
jgi:hypothetical protein